MKPKKISILITSLFLIIILIQNTRVVNLNILFWKISMSQVVLLFLISIIVSIGYFTGLVEGEDKTSKSINKNN